MKALRPIRRLPILGGIVAGGAIALAVAACGSTTTHATTTTVVQPAGAPGIPTSLSSGRGLTINQIYRAASPGVVDIVVTSSTSSPALGLFGGGTQKTQGEGAGVVYDTKGDILTDEHVVANATSAEVTFKDGRKAPAKVLGTDPSTDSAVIHVDVPSSELHPIPFANSSAAQVGDPVVAIGSPFSLPETTTAGIVSAVGRPIPAPPPNKFEIPNAVQTDAAINPGNSGGPLLDASGHVLGLNDQIQTQSGSSAGVGFAVPSNTVAQIANGIIGGHPVKHPYVGISLDPKSLTGGARIASRADQKGNAPIAPGSPAALAGLRSGDLVTAINSKPISSTGQFIVTVGAYAPGDTITLTIKRAGQTSQVKIKLAARPASAGG